MFLLLDYWIDDAREFHSKANPPWGWVELGNSITSVSLSIAGLTIEVPDDQTPAPVG
ncbi:MAG: hypothetical protein RID09_17845 [Coleofasciculus sp. G1-WW12-02]|uniref:hypothetical protein n=1 Tax=Coleofasciculus sp. G1-WW12-02 TaxID=3068483 RepID=UPI0032F0EC75